MKKLSEFKDQTHITNVLRASIIKNEPLYKITILGDEQIAFDIANAYCMSIQCYETFKGDACWGCDACVQYSQFFNWSWISQQLSFYEDKHLYVSSSSLSDFVEFQAIKPAGSVVNVDALTQVMYAWQGSKEETYANAKNLSMYYSYENFVSNILNVFVNLLYIQNNVAVIELEKFDALNELAFRIPSSKLIECVSLLWDGQPGNSAIPDALKIQSLSLLLAERLQPTSNDVKTKLWDSIRTGPISVVESVPEQPLTLEEMLELARK